jgi:hypothetical protein
MGMGVPEGVEPDAISASFEVIRRKRWVDKRTMPVSRATSGRVKATNSYPKLARRSSRYDDGPAVMLSGLAKVLEIELLGRVLVIARYTAVIEEVSLALAVLRLAVLLPPGVRVLKLPSTC